MKKDKRFDWSISDPVALARAKQEVGQIRLELETDARRVADLLEFGMLPPDVVARIRTALAHFDSQAHDD
jgi:hypothetical protein